MAPALCALIAVVNIVVAAIVAAAKATAVFMPVVDNDMAIVPVKGTEEKQGRNMKAVTPIKMQPTVITDWRPPIVGRVIRPPPIGIKMRRVVIGYVDNSGVNRVYIDIIVLPVDANMIQTIKVSRSVGVIPESLDGVENIRFLHQVSIAEALGPKAVYIHSRQQLWKGDQRFDAGIPGHVTHRVNRILAFQFRVLDRPGGGFAHLFWVGGCHQYLAEQGIGIQGDGRQHLIQLCITEALIVIVLSGVTLA